MIVKRMTECLSWLKEKKVQQVKVDSGVSFVEAGNMVQSYLPP